MLPSQIRPASLALTSLLVLLTGCGVNHTASSNTPLSSHITGTLHGGQQPVSGATVQLYTVGTTGDASAATPMLTATVTTDAHGGFDITEKYSCTNATYVYLVGTGGDPGVDGTNPNLAMMVALGPCSSLTQETFITVNELTTVAAVYALAPYMSSPAAIGSGSGDAGALGSAFTLANQLVDPATGLSPGAHVPANRTVPTALMNTLADAVASCINSNGGAAGDSSLCGRLFTLTTPDGGNAPTDTITALLNLANHATLNTGAVFNLAAPNAPFQPQMSVTPPDFLVRLTPSTPSGYVLQVAPSSLTFPATPTGSTTSAQTVVLENSGASPITLSGIAITGTDASDFNETNTCGATLAAYASCPVQVTMTPSSTGSRDAYLSVTSSSPDSPQYVTLSGTGVSAPGGAVLQLSRREIATFTSFPVGTTQDVTITNAGSSPLTIGSISHATPYYSVANHCGASVPPGGVCSLSVTNMAQSAFATLPNYFSNDNLGSSFPRGAVDAITIASNDSSGPQTLLLKDGNPAQFPSSVAFYPSNVSFPQVALGHSASTTVTVTQYYVYSLPDVSIAGADAGDFSQATVCDYYPGCEITVTFTPSATGTRTAKLIVDAAGDYIPLTGSAASSLPANQTLIPAALGFVDLAGAQPVTLSNFAGTAIGISAITLPDGFTQTNDCGSSLDAGSICTITVTSTRTTEGGVQGLLTVTGDFGTVQTGLSALVHPIMQFGSAAVSLVSPVKVALSDTSGAEALSATFSGTNPSDFPGQNCGSAYSTCAITLTATPGATGLRTATLQLNEGFPGFGNLIGNYLAEATGVAAGANLSFGGTVYQSVKLGASTTTTIRAFNTGTTTLSLGAPGLSGPDASAFTPSSNCATLAAGGSCNVTVIFAPAQTGLATATLAMTDSSSGGSFTVPLMALGEYAGLSIASASPYLFPVTSRYDESAPASFTITVPSGGAVTAALDSTTNFYLSKDSCAAGESPCVISAVFRPAATASAITANLTVTDDSGNTASIRLQGEGGAGVASASPTSLTFSDRAAGTTSIAQTIVLSNTGDLDIFVTSVTLTGTNASEFILDNSCSGEVTPAGNCNINVSFHPGTAGSKGASLVIGANNTSGALPDITVPITGMAH